MIRVSTRPHHHPPPPGHGGDPFRRLGGTRCRNRPDLPGAWSRRSLPPPWPPRAVPGADRRGPAPGGQRRRLQRLRRPDLRRRPEPGTTSALLNALSRPASGPPSSTSASGRSRTRRWSRAQQTAGHVDRQPQLDPPAHDPAQHGADAARRSARPSRRSSRPPAPRRGCSGRRTARPTPPCSRSRRSSASPRCSGPSTRRTGTAPARPRSCRPPSTLQDGGVILMHDGYQTTDQRDPADRRQPHQPQPLPRHDLTRPPAGPSRRTAAPRRPRRPRRRPPRRRRHRPPRRPRRRPPHPPAAPAAPPATAPSTAGPAASRPR